MFVRVALVLVLLTGMSLADEPALPKACIDGNGLGWRSLGLQDFEDVNCGPNTWSEKEGVIHSTGSPIGVIKLKTPVRNLEAVFEWRHTTKGGNSGMFLWAPAKVLVGCKPGTLPQGGIEVQVLDPGYTEVYEKSTGKKADWFTCHGDLFPLGATRMTPFPPVAPGGSRAFPRKSLCKPTGEWNHYYVRAINGEIRLWVNGEEVTGGTGCSPAEGYLCLESEGAPVDFRNLRIRELP